ncbi:MAG TPA: hypothetical protein VGC66_08550 [Pyrinomonadaceae bacterium]|jgi:hypothetical protein
MKCKAVLKEIEELEAGAAPTVLATEHLLVCTSCKAFAHERNALRQLVASLDNVSAPPDFDWRLRARLAEVRAEKEPTRRWLQSFAPGAQAITVAASVTLLLVAVVVYRQTQPFSASGKQSAAVAATYIKDNAKAQATALPIVNPQTFAQANGSDSMREAGTNGTVRQRGSKSIKASNTRTEVAGVATQPQRIISTDFGSRGAQDLMTAGLQGSNTTSGPVISVSMPKPKSAQLRYEDGQGTKRTLAPVNFGGQELIARPDKARLVPASEKGIW